ncbi:MAG: hypothetical protein SPF89_00055 [Sphaerochaetaceae bacterium]|nr:hypothetical protein [Spirochaetales bacterium]MDY5498477.1 hypothetical protein [Sphaerochaetaceae bacterium]
MEERLRPPGDYATGHGGACFDYHVFRSYVKHRVVPRIPLRHAEGKVPFPMFHGTDAMVLEMSDEERRETDRLLRDYVLYLRHRVPRDFWGWETRYGAQGRDMALVMTQELPKMLGKRRWWSSASLSVCGLGFACQYAVRAQYFGMVGRAAHFLALAERKATQTGKIPDVPLSGNLAKAKDLVERFWDNQPRPVVLMVEDLDDASAFLTEDGRPALEREKGWDRISCLRYISDGFRYTLPVDLVRAARIGVTPDSYGRFVHAYNLPFACVTV